MRARVVVADPTLPHQIRLTFKNGHNTMTVVSCTCGVILGEMDNVSDPWLIYNKGEHNNDVEVFVPRAHHTTGQKVYEV